MKYLAILLMLITQLSFARTANMKRIQEIVLTSNNHVVLSEAIRDSEKVVEEILKWSSNQFRLDAELYLVIDSPGGSIIAADEIENALQSISQDINTISLYAASAAFHIAQLGMKRYVSQTGIMMQHREHMYADGNTDQVMELVKVIKQIKQRWDSYEANRVGLSLNQFQQKVENDWYEYGEAAVYAGMADEVVRVVCSKELIEKEIEVPAPTFFGIPMGEPIKKSACPL